MIKGSGNRFILIGFIFFFSCSESPSGVWIDTEPSQVMVWIDEKFVGISPLKIDLKRAKDYKINFQKEGYYFYELEQRISKKEEKIQVSLNKILYSKTVQINVKPDIVYLDGQEVSLSEIKDLSIIDHQWFIFKNGYGLLKTNKGALQGEEVVRFKLNKIKRPAKVTIDAQIPAEIFLEGHKIGKIPQTLMLEPNIPYQIELRPKLSSYISDFFILQLFPNQNWKKKIILKKNKNKFTFKGVPLNTKVDMWYNGEKVISFFMDEEEKEINLDIGMYRIDMKASGYTRIQNVVNTEDISNYEIDMSSFFKGE